MCRGRKRARRVFSLVTSVLLSLQLLGMEAPRAFAESIIAEAPIEAQEDDAAGGESALTEVPAKPKAIEEDADGKGADDSIVAEGQNKDIEPDEAGEPVLGAQTSEDIEPDEAGEPVLSAQDVSEDTIYYYDEHSQTQSRTGYVEVDANTTQWAMEGADSVAYDSESGVTWYAVTSEVTVGAITVPSGAQINLVLASSLTTPGITVKDGAALRIFTRYSGPKIVCTGESAISGSGEVSLYGGILNGGTRSVVNLVGSDAKLTVAGSSEIRNGAMGVRFSGDTFNMLGGQIHDNTGDGVVISNGDFHMSGGYISFNKGLGLKMEASAGDPSLSGQVYIFENTEGNVYLQQGQKIGVQGELTTNSRVGITMENPTTGAFTDPSYGQVHGTTNPAQFFFSDKGQGTSGMGTNDPNFFVSAVLDNGCAQISNDANKRVVSFKSGLDTVEDDSMKPACMPVGTVYQLPEAVYRPLESDKKFAGWYVGSGTNNFKAAGDELTVNEDMTLTAAWGYEITFQSNGGSEVAPQVVASGRLSQRPDFPTREGYNFLGWYSDEELTQEYTFNTQVTEPITLYAKWQEKHMHDGVEFREWTSSDNPMNYGNARGYYLTEDVVLTTPWKITGYYDVRVCLNGHSIKAADNFEGNALIEVDFNDGGYTFSLYDEGEDGKLDCNGKAAGVFVRRGTFDQHGGTITKGVGNAVVRAGGVAVEAYSSSSAAAYSLHGGGIDGCESGTSANGNGGGVYVTSYGTFSMDGGYIRKCTADKRGGGLFIDAGEAMLHGGVIEQNTASQGGGGVYQSGGSIDYSDTSTSHNTAVYFGGGVYLMGGAFNMSGGTVSSNSTNNSGNGGGVCLYSGDFTMNGGSIVDNIAGKNGNGGGVYVDTSATFAVSGSNINVINNTRSDGTPDNVYLTQDKKISVKTALTGSKIGVTPASMPTEASPVVVTDGLGNVLGTVSPWEWFELDNYDNTKYTLTASDDNEAAIKLHEHTWELSTETVDGTSYAVVTCTSSDRCGYSEYERPGMICLTATDKVWDGEAATAQSIGEDGHPSTDEATVKYGYTDNFPFGDTRISVRGITFYKDGIIFGAAPSDAGSYKADAMVFVEVGASGIWMSACISAYFEITKADPTLVLTAKEGLRANGSEQELVDVEGDTDYGTLYYRLNSDGEWKTGVPSATEQGDYAVQWWFEGDSNHEDIASANEPNTVNVTVAAPIHEHEDGTTFETAWTSTTTMPTEPGTYYLTEDVTLATDWVPFSEDGKEMKICLNGHTVSGQGNQAYTQIRVDQPRSTLSIYATEGGSIKNFSSSGGALLINGIVHLYDVGISDCVAYGDGCGAVTLTSGGRLHMHGGSIKGCRGSMGGVYVTAKYGGSEVNYRFPMLSVYGSPVITDNTTSDGYAKRNVYLGLSAEPIAVCEALGEGTHIGVGHELEESKVTNGWSTHHPSDDPADFFSSDRKKASLSGNSLYVGLRDGEVAIMQHEHNWSLSVDPDDPSVAVVTCANEGCPFGDNAHTITLNAEDAVFDWKRHAATVSYGDEYVPGYEGGADYSVPVTAYESDIKYYSGDNWTNNAPEWAGEYTAKLDVNLRETHLWSVKSTVTIEKAFSIAGIPLNVTATPAEGLVYTGQPQQLVSFSGENWAGSGPVYGVYYKVDDASEYTYLSAELLPADDDMLPPMATAAGTHTVSYYYITDYDHKYSGVGSAEEPNTIEVTIESGAEPAFMKQNLVLTGQVGLTAFLSLPETEGVDWTESYVTFDVSGRKSRSVQVAYDSTNKDTSGKYYGFTVPLSSVEMAQPVMATLHYTQDGVEKELAADKALSVKGYVEGFEKVASSYDETTVALVHAVADYGHWVQPFLSASNGWTTGGGDDQYAEMGKFYAQSYDKDAARAATAGYGLSKDIDDTAVMKVTASLALESETTLDIILTVNEGVTPAVTYVTIGDRSVEGVAPTKLGNASGGGVRWRVRVPGIRGWELGLPVVVTGDAEGGFSVTASCLAYAGAILGIDSFDANGGHDAICALVAYGDAEVAYRNAD